MKFCKLKLYYKWASLRKKNEHNELNLPAAKEWQLQGHQLLELVWQRHCLCTVTWVQSWELKPKQIKLTHKRKRLLPAPLSLHPDMTYTVDRAFKNQYPSLSLSLSPPSHTHTHIKHHLHDVIVLYFSKCRCLLQDKTKGVNIWQSHRVVPLHRLKAL